MKTILIFPYLSSIFTLKGKKGVKIKKRKKVISIVALSAVIIACLTACSTSDSSTPESAAAAAAVEDAAAEDEAPETEVQDDAASDETVSESTADSISDEAFAQYLTEVKATQYFTDDPVPEEDVETILNAGINSEMTTIVE